MRAWMPLFQSENVLTGNVNLNTACTQTLRHNAYMQREDLDHAFSNDNALYSYFSL